MSEEVKDCAFQYAYKKWDVHIEKDTDLITLTEAKELYRKYLPDFIRKLQNDQNPEMCIWIEMENNTNYRKSLVHLDANFKTDGTRVWQEKVEINYPEIE